MVVSTVAMGSPLGPTLANIFMGHHEKNWVDQFPQNKGKLIIYRMYIDDIFAVFNTSDEANEFLVYLNSRHGSIKFTCEHNDMSSMPFLDVLVSNRNGVHTSLFRKKTYTGLLTNYYSYTTDAYKIGLIKNMLFRAFAINSSWIGFHEEIMRIYRILQKTRFRSMLLIGSPNHSLIMFTSPQRILLQQYPMMKHLGIRNISSYPIMANIHL